MQIMLASWDTINVSQCLVGCSGGEYGDSLGLQGRGLWHVAAGASMAVTPRLKVEANVGYAAAVKLQPGEETGRDKDLGTEVNAGLSYNIAKGLDVGVYGAYMWLGDFVKDRRGQPNSRIPGPPTRGSTTRSRLPRNGSGTNGAPGGNPGAFFLSGGIPYIHWLV